MERSGAGDFLVPPIQRIPPLERLFGERGLRYPFAAGREGGDLLPSCVQWRGKGEIGPGCISEKRGRTAFCRVLSIEKKKRARSPICLKKRRKHGDSLQSLLGYCKKKGMEHGWCNLGPAGKEEKGGRLLPWEFTIRGGEHSVVIVGVIQKGGV